MKKGGSRLAGSRILRGEERERYEVADSGDEDEGGEKKIGLGLRVSENETGEGRNYRRNSSESLSVHLKAFAVALSTDLENTNRPKQPPSQGLRTL